MADFFLFATFSRKVRSEKTVALCNALRRLMGERDYNSVSALVEPNQSIILGDTSHAVRIRQQLLSSESFANHLANQKPLLAIALFNRAGFLAEEFARLVYRAWFADRSSFLIFEVGRFELPFGEGDIQPVESYPLHYALFANIEEAKNISVYKPLGEETLRLVSSEYNKDYIEYLNRPSDEYLEDGSKDPFCCSIDLFDFMIRTSASREVEWHMWLYYFHHFAKGLIAAYDIDEGNQNSADEWINRGEFVLYRLFTVLSDWAFELPTLLKRDHPYILNFSPHDRHQNENIVKSAILCLSFCFYELLSSEKVRGSFKVYIASIICRRLRDSKNVEGLGAIYTTGCKLIAKGGKQGAADKVYSSELKQTWASIDHFIRSDLNELEQEIAKLLV